ncbi:MAG: amidohydrolase family protein [Candidatus Cloacimonetes bacterium]|nr:amidohydrolase family protein [Candidatus Cloacimonadota bacterium]MBS3767196.1 amidohydrolase family protein [Candidatus Cloacimonadota bacterium]
MSKKQTTIKARVLYDGKNKQEDKTVVVEDDKIVEVNDKNLEYDYEGFVTPAFIDAHSHIGMIREGEPADESEGNDLLKQILPTNNPLNSIYFDDRAFKDSVDFGVLYSCVVPGSGNLIGGEAKVIRNYASHRGEALIKDYGYKMALGYNPRSTTGWKGKRPNTRMGVYALLEEKLDDLLIKKEKAKLKKKKELFGLKEKFEQDKITPEQFEEHKQVIQSEYEFNFSSVEKALFQLMQGEKTAKVHVHKEDDVLYLVDLVKKYNLKVTADHTGDVFHKEIFDVLGDNDIPIVYGPLGSLAYKVELKHAYYQNTKLLMESNAFYGLMTDHPVIQSPSLRDSLKFFLIQGMSDTDAISIITYKNAKILGIEDEYGTVEADKKASIVVWDKNPLRLSAFPKLVMGEGKILRKKE